MDGGSANVQPFLGDSKFTKLDFSEMDSGFLSDDTTPEKGPGKETYSLKRKVVTFKETPVKFPRKTQDNGSLFGEAENHLSDTNKKGDDPKKTPKTDSHKPTENICDNTGSPKPCVGEALSNNLPMEEYFKRLLGEAAEDVCQKVLPGLVEIEKFEKACPCILDDLLKDAKKLEAKLLKEKMALKKRVERLMNAFCK